MKNKKKIAILMATYNGEKYIDKQLRSIIHQSYNNWKLIIHDDGSTDNTIGIINKYMKKYKNKIKLLDDDIKFHDPSKNFFYLMNYIKNKNYDYFLLSDQDDLWHENKVSTLVNIALKNEFEGPLLIHSDSNVIDKNDNVINNSFNKLSTLCMTRSDFQSITFWNVSQGCALMCNMEILKYISIDINNIYMHDWWLCIVASFFGKIIYTNEKLFSYRIHGENYQGMGRNYGNEYKRDFLKKLLTYKKRAKAYYNGNKKQLMEVSKYMNKMSTKQTKLYTSTYKVFDSNLFTILAFLIRNRIYIKMNLKTVIHFIVGNLK